MSRDDFTQKTKDLLAKRVSYRCSNPGCERITVGANSSNEKFTNIGVASHISAAAPGGPRYNSELTREERISSENGIWLCQTCSVLVDKDPLKYPIELLKKWKSDSEEKSMGDVNNPNNSNEYSNEEYYYDYEWFEQVLLYGDVEGEIRNDVIALLSACRNTSSWDSRSEMKLDSWLEDDTEESIFSQPADVLKIIRKNLVEYLQIHIEMDLELEKVPIMDSINENILYEYIEIHPSFTVTQIANANRVTLNATKLALENLYKKGLITTIALTNDSSKSFEDIKWIKNFG